ncbi:methyltransferase domain-containing protein [Patescibacteria group bacterium]|nr:methyltransferase domain-containing protein [Patescibacteria group bacterium]
MNKYLFILGNNYELSLIEILNYFKKNNIKIINKIYSNIFLIIETEEIIKKEIIENFGGVIKFCNFIEETKKINSEKLVNIIKEYNINEKIFFGISIYNFDININKIGLQIKNELKRNNISSRFVTSSQKDLSSVVVQKNKLLSNRGFEFIIIEFQNKYLIAKTESVQDFEKYSYFDFGRPNRDSKSGMLPPKLCKIMINISNTKKDSIILDPFCGSGSLIQELILLKYKNIIGTDISDKAIEDTRKNLEWLKNNLETKINPRIENKDVKNLDFERDSIDTIITEPYLGPNDFNPKNIKEIMEIKRDLEDLYIEAFRNFKKILKRGGEVIIIFPIFKNIHDEIKFIHLDLLKNIENIGFIKNNFNKEFDLNLKDFVYSRENQNIYREIHKFIKN